LIHISPRPHDFPQGKKKKQKGDGRVYLDETNVGRVLTEALTTHVQVVLSDEGGLMGTDPALARAFSVFLGVGVPDSGVGHF
jgi:hypothetical protein